MNWKNLVGLLLAAVSLSGHAADRSEFEPYDAANGSAMFKYWIWADEPNEPEAEQARISMLNMYLTKSDYCQNGYKIVSRKVAWRGGRNDDQKKIYYVGVCN